MKRRLFNLAVVASLMFFVLFVLLWCSSYREGFRLRMERGGASAASLQIESARGELIIGVRPLASYETARVRGWSFERIPFQQTTGTAANEGLGAVDVRWGLYAGGMRFMLTDWSLPVSIAGVLPSVWSWRKWRGRPSGLCRNCGYDLRASPDRCPECGTANPAK